MKAIVIKYDVYSNAVHKSARLFERLSPLCSHVDVDEVNNVVYIHFISNFNLSSASAYLHGYGILHRVSLI